MCLRVASGCYINSTRDTGAFSSSRASASAIHTSMAFKSPLLLGIVLASLLLLTQDVTAATDRLTDKAKESDGKPTGGDGTNEEKMGHGHGYGYGGGGYSGGYGGGYGGYTPGHGWYGGGYGYYPGHGGGYGGGYGHYHGHGGGYGHYHGHGGEYVGRHGGYGGGGSSGGWH
ncbi:hypothetical protein GQ55_4G250700 [Panicum hallii var. hallii]|uniref:Uncharacterized protein n=1 Tax=Panicum hallii var. hallii TaxID=1504633 RepID=A0A2T7DZY3_9POAL|nr:hypothetical protein GQ55_4G250700 [Panicum hallii var. hallii]